MKLINLYKYRTLLASVILCFLYQCIRANRNLSLHLNPYCEDYSVCSDIQNDLVYVEAIGSNDILHYLWSMQGVPSSLIVRTSLNSTLKVNWTNLLSESTNDSITFSEKPIYSFGMLLPKIWQYNDTDDSADMTRHNAQEFDFSNAKWKTINNTYNASDECSVIFSSEQNSSSGLLSEGTFSLKLSSYGSDGRSTKLPHLLHNSGTSQIGIILDKLMVTNKTSRYALEFMIMYDSKNESGKLAKKENTTLDDEYTPGVFTIVELKTPSICDGEKCSGYLFWKPIAYTDPQSTVAHSTDVKLYSIELNKSFPFSIVQAFFGVHQFVSTASWNISLGVSNDSFYNKTQYTSWSLIIGLGVPPQDTPSLLLILTIAIGFGAPFLFMVGGGAYMGFRRFLRKEDDLLLSRDSM